MKPALLVIDVQKQFFNNSPETDRSLKDAIEYINETINLFRKKDLPIFVIQHRDDEDKLMPGESGFDLPYELKILSTDRHIQKTYSNSFSHTNLSDELHKLGVDTVVLTGYCAEYCVLSTYRGAMDMDLTPLMLRGGLASSTLENIRFVENISNLISLGALQKFLD